MQDIYKVRLISFGWGFLSLLGLALAGVLTSPDFAALIKANFGDTAFIGFLLLLVPEVAKHIRNLSEVKKLGSDKKVFLI